MEDKNILLIINPCAGKMKVKSTLFDIIEALSGDNAKITVVLTKRRGHATEIAKNAEKENYSLIVCCGGDGTLNEVVSGVMQQTDKLPVGYIPAGSTNDFALSMGLPLEPKKAAGLISKNGKSTIDVGSFNGRFFTYIASFGLFTSVSYTTSQSAKNVLGHTAYVLEGIKDLANISVYNVKVTANDRVFHDEYIFGAVSNSTSVGGIVKLGSEMVRLDDGLFEVVLVKNPKNFAELGSIIYGLSNSDFSDKIFDFFKASEIKFESDGGLEWSLDGEHETENGTVKVKNIQNAITLIR